MEKVKNIGEEYWGFARPQDIREKINRNNRVRAMREKLKLQRKIAFKKLIQEREL